ncbi:GGDEF domain-containing protein [Sporosarcina ureae]|uniref:GGDEF domain-containing protein n=1 Tax=Sporosarcina ureae TaxID=1571 RepID=UPI0009DC6BB1|nr:GGDEF domain-containing protein [Sporosarcina ureae]ARF17607.1 hypothetical protein SporoP17a_10215 [Sporosarcina ureae]
MASSNFIYDLDKEGYPSGKFKNMSNGFYQVPIASFDGTSKGYSRDVEKEMLYWRKLACQDDLTKLPNRRAFYFIIESYLQKVEHRSEKVVFFYIDINQFKLINDTYGHSGADEILRELGSRLQTLSLTKEVFHFSGDEFVIIYRYQDNFQSRLSEIQSICDKPFKLANEEIDIRISIGASLYPTHSTDVATLLQYADSAMYVAKRSKSNTFCLYH